jgi:hypothetical protein
MGVSRDVFLSIPRDAYSMKSYPCEIPSSQRDSAVWQSKIAEIPSGGCGDDVDCGQQSLRRQTENPYGRQLFRHLIATALLAAITVVFWLSLIKLAPGAYAHSAERTNPAEQSTSATTSSKH